MAMGIAKRKMDPLQESNVQIFIHKLCDHAKYISDTYVHRWILES